MSKISFPVRNSNETIKCIDFEVTRGLRLLDLWNRKTETYNDFYQIFYTEQVLSSNTNSIQLYKICHLECISKCGNNQIKYFRI